MVDTSNWVATTSTATRSDAVWPIASCALTLTVRGPSVVKREKPNAPQYAPLLGTSGIE